MCHLNSMLLAVSRDPNPTRFQKTWGLNDFYFPSKEWSRVRDDSPEMPWECIALLRRARSGPGACYQD